MNPTGPVGDVLVLFGVTGDLAKKMILPALYRLVERGELTVPVVGVALTDWDVEQLRAHVADSVHAAFDNTGDHGDRADSGSGDDVDDDVLKRLQGLMQLVAGDYADPATFQRLAAEVATQGGAEAFAVYYLAVPPSLFATVADGLAAVGLNDRARLVVEKPFGHDLDSARALNAMLRKNYADDRIFRVDHYLGKEPVEDLLVLRFANTLLEPLWTRTWIDHVEITMAESFDVADRGSFYDSVGTVRDVVQNHLLQVLAYLGMEAPSSDSAADQRDAKFQLLKAVRAVDPADVVRGQYTGYRDVKGVAPDSTTETYVALTLHIDNWRWSGVPVHIVAGKALPASVLDIVVTLRRPPRALFAGPTDSPAPPNRIRLRLQPDAGVAFILLAKQPGGADVVTEVPIAVDFREVLGPVHAPYERIFVDALVGDPAHFAPMDNLEEAWRIVAPILDPGTEPLPYEPGTWGPTPPA
ncbi:glucose-6-phosphate dehydrogenase [Pseudonocardia sp.]|jgi:glucose-6-phosphate 1-dehydrogenase|uniref:glucose-6-phosphate dehydrogenase n=1 Tax=Pseudonocardia sp. TaxID=60912 RepID=UPI00262C52A9|nr:glucose-6-phosphate dehydrogenase [Pseudonocardia sp.]MCW2718365.1 glucose-6-phosphate 1-dehydrogenase [Pseudonocardia sp.]MDT7617985.1 glucose-6-phosphate 1-dehydrogenase [Pseudonocardiales bacterium]